MTAVFSPTYLLESSVSWFDNSFERVPTLNPDTNGNGILFVDNRPDLGGNGDGYFQARERDPGEDYDRDRAYDLYEDFNHNNRLDFNEDRDGDGRLRPAPPEPGKGPALQDMGLSGRAVDLHPHVPGRFLEHSRLGAPQIPGRSRAARGRLAGLSRLAASQRAAGVRRNKNRYPCGRISSKMRPAGDRKRR